MMMQVLIRKNKYHKTLEEQTFSDASSHTVTLKHNAILYVEHCLEQSASFLDYRLPFSNRTAMVLFFVQAIWTIIMLLASYGQRPHITEVYNDHRWFILTFRAELLQPVMYKVARLI